jgi:hypothetical protein
MIYRRTPMTLFAGPSTTIRGISFSAFVFSHRRLLSRRWAAEIHDGDPLLTKKLTPYVSFVYRRGLTRPQIRTAHDDMIGLLNDAAEEGLCLYDAVEAVAEILIRFGRIEPDIYQYDLKGKDVYLP